MVIFPSYPVTVPACSNGKREDMCDLGQYVSNGDPGADFRIGANKSLIKYKIQVGASHLEIFHIGIPEVTG
jgi:hypothetical protein